MNLIKKQTMGLSRVAREEGATLPDASARARGGDLSVREAGAVLLALHERHHRRVPAVRGHLSGEAAPLLPHAREVAPQQ